MLQTNPCFCQKMVYISSQTTWVVPLYQWVIRLALFSRKCGTYLIEALFLVSGTEGVGFYEERNGGEVCSANWSQLTAECFDAKPFIRSCS